MVPLKSPYFNVAANDDEVVEIPLPELAKSVERNPAYEAYEAVINSLFNTSQNWIASRLELIKRPGLLLDLGVPSDSNLLRVHKLHLYGVALADKVKAATGVQFCSVKIAKHHGDSARLTVTEALPAKRPAAAAAVTITTRHSYAKPAFEQAINEVTQDIRKVVAAGDALRLNVSYLTGLPRTWSRLWEPTIAGIFGRPSARSASVDSSQVVRLEFDHRSIGDDLGHQVYLAISTSPIRI